MLNMRLDHSDHRWTVDTVEDFRSGEPHARTPLPKESEASRLKTVLICLCEAPGLGPHQRERTAESARTMNVVTGVVNFTKIDLKMESSVWGFHIYGQKAPKGRGSRAGLLAFYAGRSSRGYSPK